MMVIGTIAVLVVLIVVAVIGIRNAQEDGSATPSALSEVSGQGAAAAPPWPVPSDVSARVAAAGMDTGPMGTADHYHAHLDIIIDGESVPVPADLGVDPASGAMSAVHTHTRDGIVHVEADEEGQTFTLGQLFTEWDVRLTADQVGSLMAEDGSELKVYVNGTEQPGEPAMLRLADEQQVTLVYGDQQVDIPDSYDFSGV